MTQLRRRGKSGQILLIAAFLAASLLLSAELYVFDVGRFSGEVESVSLSDFVLAVKLGSRHVVVGSLANVSNGGSGSVLELNLQGWASVVGEWYQFGKGVLNYTLMDAAPYSSGVWLYWGTGGYGVSSAYASFTHQLSGQGITADQSYSMNITSSVFVESVFQRIGGNRKRVNVTVDALNEAEPALAEQLVIYYRLLGVWVTPGAGSGYTLFDYGNGTYLASFEVIIPAITVEISTHVVDGRGIYVSANATSVET